MKKFDSNILNKALNIGYSDATSRGVYSETRLTSQYRDLLYENSSIISRIVDILPTYATKEMVEVKTGNNDLDSTVEYYLDSEDILGLLKQQLIEAQVHGGSAIWMFKAGSNLDSGDYDALIALSVEEVTQSSSMVIQDPLNSEFGYPLTYQITPTQVSTSGYEVSHKRLLRLTGIDVPRRRASYYSYFGKSYLERLYENVMLLESSYPQVSQILSDYTKDVLKTDVINQLSCLGDNFQKRLQFLALTKNNRGVIAVDKESEDYQQLTRNVSGINDLLEHLKEYLVLATGFPRIIIFGESPHGLNASGETDLENFYNTVRGYQKSKVLPALQKILEAKFPELPEDYTIEFKSLAKPNIEIESKSRESNAKADQIYIETGVLLPEQVSRERFGGDCYSHNISLTEEDLNDLTGVIEDEPEDDIMK